MGNTAHVTLGGKGSNQAVAAALGGARTAMIARVGADAEGERARGGLAGRGVDVSGVASVPGDETGTAWITVAAGDNTIIVIAGANHRWPADGDPLDGSGETAAVVPDELIELCDVLIVNEHEQAVVARQTASGDDPADPAAVRRAHLALR